MVMKVEIVAVVVSECVVSVSEGESESECESEWVSVRESDCSGVQGASYRHCFEGPLVWIITAVDITMRCFMTIPILPTSIPA